MRDAAARVRTGLSAKSSPEAGASVDPRIHVGAVELRRLESKAKALRFLPRQPARSVLNGRHASRLRGRGLNFEELRGYLPGDDTRAIDWKVTARTGEPHIRVYTEERDRPALLVVDQRMSMFFGSRLNMKSVTAAETAALAAFRILDQGDRIGGMVFGDRMIAEFKPQRSRRVVDALIKAIGTANQALSADAPVSDPMPLNRVLEATARVAKRDHLVIVISDFDGIDARSKTLIGGLARHNDIVLGLVTDPSAHTLPESKHLVVSDGMLQAEIQLDSGSVRRALAKMSEGRLADILEWERSLGVPVLPLSAGEPTLPQVTKLMGLPGKRR
ncbi:MAG: DUF58 domain-containing protein [Pseudomonadota bacterium]